MPPGRPSTIAAQKPSYPSDAVVRVRRLVSRCRRSRAPGFPGHAKPTSGGGRGRGDVGGGLSVVGLSVVGDAAGAPRRADVRTGACEGARSCGSLRRVPRAGGGRRLARGWRRDDRYGGVEPVGGERADAARARGRGGALRGARSARGGRGGGGGGG